MEAGTLTGEFVHSFAIKDASEETTYNGETGLFIQGYMAVWQPKDRQGEDWNLDFSPGSPTRQALETYFTRNPVVMFNHGRDQKIGAKAIGRTVDWKVDENGIWVKDFIQKPEAGTELMNVYRSIKSGIYRTFSIAAEYLINRANTIRHLLDVKEHSVVTVPAQAHATFTLSSSMKAAFEQALGANQMEPQEALLLAQNIKAGRSISSANAAKIQAAIQTLQELLGGNVEIEAESPEDEGMEMESGMMGCAPGTKKPGMKSEALQALEILQGVKTKMSDKAKEGAPENNGVVTLTKEQFDQFNSILAERETLRLEREAEKMAQAKLADEQKAAEEAAKKAAEEQERLDKMVEEKLATYRTGSKMVFEGGQKSNFYVNKGKGEDFQFVKFLREGRRGKHWEYMEKMYTNQGEKAQLNESVNTAGGFLVPTEQSTELVDTLRANSVVRALSPRVLPMSSDTLTIPRLTSGATAYWTSEASTITGSTQAFGQIRLVAKKLAVLVAVTQEMIDDSNPGIEQIIRDDMAKQLALAEDLAYLNGAGTSDTPLGVMKTPGITNLTYVTGAVSAAPELTNLNKAAAAVRNANANPNGIVMHSRHNAYLLNVVDTAGQPAFGNLVGGFRWSDMNLNALKANNNPNAPQVGSLLGMRQALSNQLTISATTSGTGPVIVGDWGQLIIGERQDVQFKVSDQVGFTSDVVYIKVTRRVDCALAIPSAFAVISAFPATDVA